MSVIRPRPPTDPISVVPPPSRPAGPAGAADSAIPGGSEHPACTRPQTATREQPAEMLADYRLQRPTSQLHAVLQRARLIRDRCDRVIVVAPAGETAAARALLSTCCHPFHDALSRAERGGRPRILFSGAAFANDRDQGLLDLVAPGGRASGDDLLDRWALVVVANTTIPPAVAAAARLFLDALAAQVGGLRSSLADRVVTVGEPLEPLAKRLGCDPPLPLPALGADGRSVFSAAAFLPAAIAGVDVVRVLEGAVAMNSHTAESPPDENPVHRLLACGSPSAVPDARQHASPRRLPRLIAADEQLEPLIAWHERLQDSLTGHGPPTATVRITGGEPRRDPLRFPPAGSWWPEETGPPLAAPENASGSGWAEPLPAAPAEGEIRLPRLDEHAVGQLLQLLLLSTDEAAAGR